MAHVRITITADDGREETVELPVSEDMMSAGANAAPQFFSSMYTKFTFAYFRLYDKKEDVK